MPSHGDSLHLRAGIVDSGNYTTRCHKQKRLPPASIATYCTGEVKFPVAALNPGSLLGSYRRLERSKILPFRITVSIFRVSLIRAAGFPATITRLASRPVCKLPHSCSACIIFAALNVPLRLPFHALTPPPPTNSPP